MVTMEIERITPAKAASYLKTNLNNYRKISRATVRHYAEDMKSGRWEMNGEAIVFDENGMLKNGQHRLAAVVLANVPVEMTVIRGVKEDVTAFDLGSVRTAGQIAAARGLDSSKPTITAVNLLLSISGNGEHTKMMVADYYEKHENELNRAYRCMLNGEYTKKVKRGSLVLAAYMMLSLGKMTFYELEVFFKAFTQMDGFGCDGYEVSPAIVARKMFDEWWSKGSCLRTQREQLDVTIKAMKDLHDGKKRTTYYKIFSPFAYEPLLNELMKEV